MERADESDEQPIAEWLTDSVPRRQGRTLSFSLYSVDSTFESFTAASSELGAGSAPNSPREATFSPLAGESRDARARVYPALNPLLHD
jgi:hypothetical protein